MAITFDSEKRIFKLDTKDTTYMIGITSSGHAGHIYYGPGLAHACGSARLRMEEVPYTPDVLPREKVQFMDSFPFEYPTGGTGDYRGSCLDVRNQAGQRGCELFYSSYRILPGKPAAEGMPSSFPGEEAVGKDGVETLQLILRDPVLKLTVTLEYSVFPAENVIVRRAVISSAEDAEPLYLEKASSACIDMDNRNFEMITLDGSWARERHISRSILRPGFQGISSSRGETSHQEQPFLALLTPGTDQGKGEVWAMDLVWSGNFRAQAECSHHGSVRMSLGVNDTDFSWKLDPGCCFATPESVLTYSASGLGTMTRQFHDFWRGHMIRSRYLHRDRPILINNWEATYFDFNTDKLLAIAQEAKKAGIEMLVMDDGWFGKRNNDDCALGDWTVNEDKITGGLKHLVDEVNRIGLKFGIWFEPEMISPDSDLYRQHPDWALRQAGREPAQSRQQYVLDLSRKEIRDYVYDQVAAVLHSANIEYVKWDMNRYLSDLGSAELPAERQGEIAFRYVLGVYEMQERLIQEFPDLLLENCSGGGARFDAGMLYYSPQIWCSDDTDAIERLRIQEGTSMLYPLSTMGAHVSKCPNEQVGRNTDFATRGNVALSGTFGYELDITKMDPAEREAIPGQVANYHRFHRLIAEGDYYRLASWNDLQPYDAWIVVSKDRKEALLTAVQVLGRPNAKSRILTLAGLDPSAVYTVEDVMEGKETGKEYGDSLMQCGILIPNMGDFKSRLWYFSV